MEEIQALSLIKMDSVAVVGRVDNVDKLLGKEQYPNMWEETCPVAHIFWKLKQTCQTATVENDRKRTEKETGLKDAFYIYVGR